MPVNKVRRRGSYAPLSAHYYKDTAVIEAGEKAELLYVRSLAFCADVLSDGFISDAQLVHCAIGLTSVRARVARLVDVGLWVRVNGGYAVRSWLHWNRSRDDILQMADQDSQRKKPQVSEYDPPPDPTDEGEPVESDSERNPNGIREGSHARRPARAPSKANSSSNSNSTPELPLAPRGGSGGSSPEPIPADESKTASRKRSADPRGHRLPDDWWPDADDLAWYRENCPALAAVANRGQKLTEEFRDYWWSKAGKDARKVDWSRTWRNRMRDREDQAVNQQSRGRPGSPNARPSASDAAVAQAQSLRRGPRPEPPSDTSGSPPRLATSNGLVIDYHRPESA